MTYCPSIYYCKIDCCKNRESVRHRSRRVSDEEIRRRMSILRYCLLVLLPYAGLSQSAPAESGPPANLWTAQAPAPPSDVLEKEPPDPKPELYPINCWYASVRT